MAPSNNDIPALYLGEFDDFVGRYAIIMLEGKGHKYTKFIGFERDADNKLAPKNQLLFKPELEGDVQIHARVVRESRRLLFLEDIAIDNVLLGRAHADATPERPTVWGNKNLPFGAIAKDDIRGIFYQPNEPYTPENTRADS